MLRTKKNIFMLVLCVQVSNILVCSTTNPKISQSNHDLLQIGAERAATRDLYHQLLTSTQAVMSKLQQATQDSNNQAATDLLVNCSKEIQTILTSHTPEAQQRLTAQHLQKLTAQFECSIQSNH